MTIVHDSHVEKLLMTKKMVAMTVDAAAVDHDDVGDNDDSADDVGTSAVGHHADNTHSLRRLPLLTLLLQRLLVKASTMRLLLRLFGVAHVLVLILVRRISCTCHGSQP